jgi:enoyl-CoA hydratase/carnithine racemase
VNYEKIRLQASTPVARLTMSWPEKRNALSIRMMEEITAGLKELESAPGVGAIVLGAEGSVFSAGHYLPEMIDKDLDHQRRVFSVCVEMMETIQRIDKPVVAEVPGVATAAGCQLVATCDLAVASDDARFATPGVRIGLFCSPPMVAVSRVVGRKRAMEMLLTGELIDARTAVEWGLLNRVVPKAALREETERLAGKVAEASSFVVGLGKRAFYSQLDLDQARAYDYTKEVMSMNAMARDAQEGMTAFLEKRKPCWVGS